ncbi:baeRF10 domain-containing protein [Roseimaritima sediminicola]|uniref:baeRF10 domain-containing protein n=1 Tax=Roseimaritima sediminicola TaxID=2662066 RepID=UPI0012983773|nr:Vms1/Ankzf1 family peptidyl-tRNA hydrolase [Roseimaritima sediminicola]
MTLQQIDLRELSEIRGNGRDVLTAYFRGADGLSQLSHREKQIRDLVDDALELENFEASLSNLRSLLEDNDVSDAVGVCAISSAVLDICRMYPIAMEVPNRLTFGPAPFIRPLAELQDEYETFLLLACDNDRTRIFTVTNEAAEAESAIKGGIKNHVRKGGWSQQRYERRRDNQLEHYGDEVAGELESLIRELDIRRIVLAGSEETMQAIESQLPERIGELVVGREAFDLDRPEDELVEVAYEDYFAQERRDEKDLWKRIQGAALSDGRGCLGPKETLAAAKIGRVETAIASRDLRTQATKCRQCEDVTGESVDKCPGCGSGDVFDVDYIDTLARHLELTSAALDFVDPIEPLSKAGHVAALLRY